MPIETLSTPPDPIENLPKKELAKRMAELEILIADLIEKGTEWSSNQRKIIRQQIQQSLQDLGLVTFDHDKLIKIYERLNLQMKDLPTPIGYPSKTELSNKLRDVVQNPLSLEHLPQSSQSILASDVATFAQAEWTEIHGRGGINTLNYLYDLGKILSDPYASDVLFENDPIQIGSEWRAENGRHRALTLRALGYNWVTNLGMNQWIQIERK